MSKVANYEEVIEKLKTKFIDYLEEKGINTKTNFQCLCPDHEDTNASMGVVPQSNYTKAHCFACGGIADIFDAVAVLDGKPKNGPNYIEETVMWLAEKYQVAVEFKELTEEEKYRIQIFNAYKYAANYVSANPSPAAIADMERREWKIDECARRLIGGVPSFQAYKEYMVGTLEFSPSFLFDVDLLNPGIFNENGLVFAVADTYGRPCGFSTRNLAWDPKSEDQYLKRKYHNTSAKCAIYEKSKRLYNIHNTKMDKGTVYITEGCADTEAMLQHGFGNSVGIGGTAFTDYHVLELAKTGRTNVTILADGDPAGTKATERILEKFSDNRDFSLYVINLPNGLDPDDFMKTMGPSEFNKLKRWSAFEWKLSTYDELIETSLIRKEIIPIIAIEGSPIEREKMVVALSEKIDLHVDAIRDEVKQVLDSNEQKRAKERDGILNELITDLKNSPTSWRHTLDAAKDNLECAAEKHSEDSFSPQMYLKELDAFKDEEEDDDVGGTSCCFWKWKEFQEAIDGNHEATLNVLGGQANCGKTAWMSGAALMHADIPDSFGKDYFVIFHTIDDTLKQFTNRLITQIAVEKYSEITLNMVKAPGKFQQARLINDARTFAYNKFRSLVQQQKILVRGGEEKGAGTLAYADGLIKYAKKARPEAQVIYFLDNFHRLRDFSGEKDERNKFKKLSNAAKDMAKRHGIPVWATMEYNKSVAQGRPTNNSISESIAMEYDANFIMHLYNDMHVKNQLGEEPDLFFVRPNAEGVLYKSPRIEAIVGKNKLNSFKGSLWFDFYADQSRMHPVSASQVKEDIDRTKSERES